MHRTTGRLVRLACALPLLAGCGGDPLGRRAVSGTVLFNGAPLDQGRIHFAPAGKGPTESGAPIENGAYRIPRDTGLAPGTYTVTVWSYDQKGAKVPSADVPGDPGNTQFKERIPAKYNTKSTLTADVKPDGPNVLDFKLD